MKFGNIIFKLMAALLFLPALARGEEAGLSSATVSPDTVTVMDIEEVILRARANSVDAAVSLDRLRTAWWEYRYYLADLLPEVSFKATLPAYYKQYSA